MDTLDVVDGIERFVNKEIATVVTVDVIVPAKDEEVHLPDLIAALVRQTVPPRKVFLVIAPSQDRTLDLALRLAREHPAFNVIHNPAGSAAVAMNLGLQRVEADSWMRIDGHTRIPDDLIEVLRNELNDHQVDCVGPVLKAGSRNRRQRGIGLAMSSPLGVGSATFRTGRGSPGPTDAVAFGLYRRTATDRIGNFRVEMVRNQDDEFNTRFRKSGARLWLTHSAMVEYFPRSKLRDLFRQYHEYGYWRFLGTLRYGNQLRWRQAVPSVLFVSCALSIGASTVVRSRWPVVLFAAGYGVIPLMQTVLARRFGADWPSAMASGGAVATMHWSYGLGSVRGLVAWLKQPRRGN